MKLEILIRTHAPDAQWLEWCLLSCKQRVPEIPVTVVCPITDGPRIKLVTDKFDLPLSTVYPVHKDGYMDQQWTKLNADHFCKDADYIIHVDSDCIWTAGVEGLFSDGKPLMLKTPYDELQSGGAGVWQGITERALGYRPEFEYMRRMPLVYPRIAYSLLRSHLREVHAKDGGLEKWFAGLENREFSEFNALGLFCDWYLTEQFTWVDTSRVGSGFCQETLPEPVMRQGWSWGGMTPEVKQEWRAHVKA